MKRRPFGTRQMPMICTWAVGAGRLPRYFWTGLTPQLKKSGSTSEFDDSVNAPICRPKPLTDAFNAAGLIDVETTAIDIPTPFVNFDDYWSPFLGGTGSAPRYCMPLDEGTRNLIKTSVQAKLPTGPDGGILLAARAWAVKGKIPSPVRG